MYSVIISEIVALSLVVRSDACTELAVILHKSWHIITSGVVGYDTLVPSAITVIAPHCYASVPKTYTPNLQARGWSIRRGGWSERKKPVPGWRKGWPRHAPINTDDDDWLPGRPPRVHKRHPTFVKNFWCVKYVFIIELEKKKFPLAKVITVYKTLI